jgi:hypothetical protein
MLVCWCVCACVTAGVEIMHKCMCVDGVAWANITVTAIRINPQPFIYD